MRRSPRTSLIALLLAVLAFAAVGCGGGEVSADEVPGPPPALTVPSDTDIGSGGGDNADGAADDAGNADEDDAANDPDATATPAPGSTDTGTAPPATDGTSGGTTAPEAETAPEDTAANDTAPPADSEAEQFEDFCEQNAGAC